MSAVPAEKSTSIIAFKSEAKVSVLTVSGAETEPFAKSNKPPVASFVIVVIFRAPVDVVLSG